MVFQHCCRANDMKLCSGRLQVAPEAAVRSIQAATPPPSVKTPKPVELEGVSPKLLLPPMSKFDPLMELAGGTFELGDRVAFTGCGEGPPFGSQGCVVGIIDDAVEVLFDVSPAQGIPIPCRPQSAPSRANPLLTSWFANGISPD